MPSVKWWGKSVATSTEQKDSKSNLQSMIRAMSGSLKNSFDSRNKAAVQRLSAAKSDENSS